MIDVERDLPFIFNLPSLMGNIERRKVSHASILSELRFECNFGPNLEPVKALRVFTRQLSGES